MKFWKWLFLLSKKHYKDEHLKKQGNDMLCPSCNEWFSVSGIEYKHKQESTLGLHKCTCGQCSEVSYWSSNIAPFLVLTDSEEQPIKTT